MKKNRSLFHITRPENRASIGCRGLCANKQGLIYLFCDRRVEDEIARNQVFLNKYLLYQVNWRGIRGDVLEDNVAELSAQFHVVVSQARIAPSYLRCLGEFVTSGPASNRYATKDEIENMLKLNPDLGISPDEKIWV